MATPTFCHALSTGVTFASPGFACPLLWRRGDILARTGLCQIIFLRCPTPDAAKRSQTGADCPLGSSAHGERQSRRECYRSVHKIPAGGWFPLLVGLVVSISVEN